MTSTDVIVVGSGSGGSVVTRRLVDAGLRVLLLEAGGPDTNPAIHDPARLFELWDGDEDWGYRTAPQSGCADRSLHWPRGKVLGGSSSLNGMIYVRGHRSDFDAWAALGNPGWAYDDVLPLFRRSEAFDGGASEFHGGDGPLRVISRYEPHPLSADIVAAAEEHGIPFNEDCNGASQDGVGFCQLTIDGGLRHSAAAAFLAPVASAPNLTVVTSARVVRLRFDGERCIGVEYLLDGRSEVAYAEHEVVVCAGTIESPQLLLRSGIGAGDDVRRLGVDVVADLPGVGRNLHDHLLCPVIYATDRPVPPPLPGLQQLHSQLFWRSRPELPAPDLQPLFFHLPLYADEMDGPPDGFTLMAGIVRPQSRGAIRFTGDGDALIDPACLSLQDDVEALVAAVTLCREIGRQPALAAWGVAELYPGPEVRSPAELESYVRRNAITYHHQVGTCKLGVDELAVVDPHLRVRGLDGLRVADASVMPTVTAGNTHAPTLMIGERAAELVAGSTSGV